MVSPTFHTKVQRIAAYLYPWQVQLEPSWESSAALAHPTVAGARIHMRLSDHGRIAVSGSFPQDFYPRNEQRPRITVSVDRSPRSIADDIMRRFLPAYVSLYREMAAHAQAHAEAVAEQNAALDEIAAALGVAVHRYHDAHQEGEIYAYGRGSSQAVAHTSHAGGDVTVYLHVDRVPLDVAIEVCRLLRPTFEQ